MSKSRRIGRPSVAEPLLGYGYEQLAQLVEGDVTSKTLRSARRWLRGQADMGIVRVHRFCFATGLDAARVLDELVKRILAHKAG